MMIPIYRIHPGVGVARLGNSPDSFYIGPQQRAELPIECDDLGNPIYSPDGMTVQRVATFKDSEGRIRRQAARFEVWVYDDASPEGRPVKRGDHVEGGGNAGALVDIQWRVWLANKKAGWYQFCQLEGEHGYASNHPLRNADITDPDARQRLIIDPGPRTVDGTSQRRASFDRDGGENYSPTFPPPLKPWTIDTLGDLLTDNEGRLLVLGGHGHSGSYLYDEFGEPRIVDYANNDGWFDDTSDGPVMARLVMFSDLVGEVRFIDVEAPSWVICAYPRYVPEVLDVVTMDDVIDDLAITQFAERTDIFGTAGTFGDPPHIEPTDTDALIHWRAGRLRWNPDYKPWFYRDVWSILFRPDQFTYLCNILGQSNYPHNYSTRGSFDPAKLSVPPQVYWPGVRSCEARCMRRHHEGELFTETLAPLYMVLQKQIERELKENADSLPRDGVLTTDLSAEMQKALKTFSDTIGAPGGDEPFDVYLGRWRAASQSTETVAARGKLEETIGAIIDRAGARLSADLKADLRRLTAEHLRKHTIGKLLDDCRATCVAANTYDPYRPDRLFLFSLLRKPGEENDFFLDGKPSSRVHNLPLMPLLAGDNPISNTLPSKFLRLTEYQYYVLRQWANGDFFNEELEGWPYPNPWWPYDGTSVQTGRDLDRGVLASVLGGSFCPGGEVGWVMRNPAIWTEPYRIKADRSYSEFGQTAAQANQNHGRIPEIDYSTYTTNDLSQTTDFDTGLEPGDLTKTMSVPWQSDFNECTTQPIDVTYGEWNQINPDAPVDALMEREQRVWETLWWPAHRPTQTNEATSAGNITWLDWTPGVPQTNAGDLKMVTEWWRLPFVTRNAAYDFTLPPPQNPPPYVSKERTKR
jgi:L-Lysine epsilon oxidase N-terminal/L-lysine epsilon oxidase C-terminal domain